MIDRMLSLFHADPYGNLFRDRTLARLAKTLSPAYLYDKLALVLYERRHPDHPWLTRDAIALLEDRLRPGARGFEWGSGEGTLWFARRSASLVSVEHHEGWYERVRAKLAGAGVTNVDYRLVAEVDYTRTIDELPDACLDYVLVDGLFRDEALLRSIPKVKPGGWIVFDNVNWYLPSDSATPHSRSRADGPATEVFARAARELEGWKAIWTTNGVNDTAIFEKPAAR